MRRGTHDTDFITLDEKIIGVNLGWDFTAEHEWGISDLTNAFGLNTELLGFEGRKNTIVPEGLIFHNSEGRSYLVYNSYLDDSRINSIASSRSLIPYGDTEIGAAWSNNDFGIAVLEKNSYVLENLDDAFRTNNGVITLGGREDPFGNSGLILLDYRQIPEDMLEEARFEDKKARDHTIRCKKAEEESGVLEALKESGQKYIALSVKRFDDDGNPIWWLNPMDQKNHDFGWYTTRDLLDWAQNKGPIIK